MKVSAATTHSSGSPAKPTHKAVIEWIQGKAKEINYLHLCDDKGNKVDLDSLLVELKSSFEISESAVPGIKGRLQELENVKIGG